ncbi:MAG: hypothetical protein IKZ46_04590 [Victivallales bacterium]|nr:hypothetical protein [Victivallales bacterium]
MDWFIAKTNFISYNISVEISCAIILVKKTASDRRGFRSEKLRVATRPEAACGRPWHGGRTDAEKKRF